MLKLIWLVFLAFQMASFAKDAVVHDLKKESQLLDQLASADSDTKLNAAVELGNIFRTQGGFHPKVYKRLLKMLDPESPRAEREGAAWALGEMRYIEPSTRKLMKQYELEAMASGDTALSTALMHSLREVADVWPENGKNKCLSLLKSLTH